MRQGVDGSTAATVGMIQGASMAVGIKLPYLGQSLATRVLSGAGGNLVQGVVGALASSEVLKDGGYGRQAEPFNPWDLRARALDVMLGSAFGAMAHMGAASTNRGITPQEDYQRFLSETGLTEQRVQELMADEPVVPLPPEVTRIKKGASPIADEGMIATEDMAAGDLIAPARLSGVKTEAGRYINHSNNPNAEVRAKNNGDLEVYALHPIGANEEVLVNYRQVGEVNGSELRGLTPTEEAALLVANQARHIEDATSYGRPASDADATMHADALLRAVDQVLRGTQVVVDDIVRDMRMVPDDARHQQQMEIMAEAQRIAEQEGQFNSIQPKTTSTGLLADDIPANSDPTSIQARRLATEQPDLTIPTSRVDADGNPVTMRAADAIAQADADVVNAQATAANLFRTAANCLLGAL